MNYGLNKTISPLGKQEKSRILVMKLKYQWDFDMKLLNIQEKIYYQRLSSFFAFLSCIANLQAALWEISCVSALSFAAHAAFCSPMPNQ
jgi:hypothetical protein